MTHGHDGSLVVGHGIIFALLGFWLCGDIIEDFLDFVLDIVDVDVAYNNDTLQIGAIPCLIVVAQSLIGEVVDNLHRADGQTLAIFGCGIDGGQNALHDALLADVA